MGIVYKNGGWWIRINGDEHPPLHCHVVHPDGEALLYVSGKTINRHVPEAVVAQAQTGLTKHPDMVRIEWERLNSPKKPLLNCQENHLFGNDFGTARMVSGQSILILS